MKLRLLVPVAIVASVSLIGLAGCQAATPAPASSAAAASTAVLPVDSNPIVNASTAPGLTIVSAAEKLGAIRIGALAAGIAYLIWLPLLGGRGGQAPVFYSLFIAVAARLTLRLPELARHRAIGAMVANGIGACLLAGVAIQLKPTAAFEGAFFGLAHVYWLLRARGLAVGAGAGLLLATIGLAPTLAVAAGYHALGPAPFEAWWFANVTSIFLRPGYPASDLAMRLLGIAAQLSPLVLCAAIGWRRRRFRLVEERLLAFGWLGAAVVGFLAIGTFFDHYALPLVAPLAVTGAVALGRMPRVLIGTLGLALLLMIVERAFVPNDRDGAREVARIVAANSRDGCPWVFIGDTATYSLSRACLPTPYAFPNFLAYTTEAGAVGIDEAAEVRRILASRPPVIVGSTRRLAIWNPRTTAMLQDALARDYRPVFSTKRANYRTVVLLRRDLSFRR